VGGGYVEHRKDKGSAGKGELRGGGGGGVGGGKGKGKEREKRTRTKFNKKERKEPKIALAPSHAKKKETAVHAGLGKRTKVGKKKKNGFGNYRGEQRKQYSREDIRVTRLVRGKNLSSGEKGFRQKKRKKKKKKKKRAEEMGHLKDRPGSD